MIRIVIVDDESITRQWVKKKIEDNKEKINLDDKLQKKILVNMITSLRGVGGILLVPIFTIYGSIPASIWFVLFMATDWIDGYLARKYEVSSFFGALLDGMFDKLFGIISFLLLASISPSYTIPLLFEAGILSYGLYSASKGNNIKSSLIGKTKMWFLAASAFLGFLNTDYLALENFLTTLNLTVVPLDNLVKLEKVTSTALVGMEALSLTSYVVNDKLQDNIKSVKVPLKVKDIKDVIISRDEETKNEVKMRLFDTNYYEENKDKPLSLLLNLKKHENI